MAFSTNPLNSTNVLELVTYTNDVTNGWMGTIVLVMVFGIMYLVMQSHSSSGKAMAASLFITTGFAVFFRTMGWINDYVMLVVVLVAGISIVAIVYEAVSLR